MDAELEQSVYIVDDTAVGASPAVEVNYKTHSDKITLEGLRNVSRDDGCTDAPGVDFSRN